MMHCLRLKTGFTYEKEALKEGVAGRPRQKVCPVITAK